MRPAPWLSVNRSHNGSRELGLESESELLTAASNAERGDSEVSSASSAFSRVGRQAGGRNRFSKAAGLSLLAAAVLGVVVVAGVFLRGSQKIDASSTASEAELVADGQQESEEGEEGEQRSGAFDPSQYCGDNEEYISGLCYKKCSELTSDRYPIRTSAWTCCSGEPCGPSETEVNVGVCGGYSVSGTNGCPGRPGICKSSEERYDGLCYKSCASLTNDEYPNRIGPGTCCSYSGGGSHKFALLECLKPGKSITRPEFDQGDQGCRGQESCPPHQPTDPLQKRAGAYRRPERVGNGKDCGPQMELFGGLCYKLCALLSNGTYPVRASGWSCCTKDPCELDHTNLNMGVCDGYSVAVGSDGKEICPHPPSDCHNDEENHGGTCFYKCDILTNSEYPFRMSAGSCCKKDPSLNLGNILDCLEPGNSLTSDAFDVGGMSRKTEAEHAAAAHAAHAAATHGQQPGSAPAPSPAPHHHALSHAGSHQPGAGFEELVGGWFYIRNGKTGLCVHAEDSQDKAAVGAKLVYRSSCKGMEAMFEKVVDSELDASAGHLRFHMKHVSSGLCVNANGGAQSGSEFTLDETCGGEENKLTKAGDADGSSFLKSAQSGDEDLCWHAEGGEPQDGTKVVYAEGCTGSANELQFPRADVEEVAEECETYMAKEGCDWAAEFRCPSHFDAGRNQAINDGSFGFMCCCSYQLWKQDGVSLSLDFPECTAALLHNENALSQFKAAAARTIAGKAVTTAEKVKIEVSHSKGIVLDVTIIAPNTLEADRMKHNLNDDNELESQIQVAMKTIPGVQTMCPGNNGTAPHEETKATTHDMDSECEVILEDHLVNEEVVARCESSCKASGSSNMTEPLARLHAMRHDTSGSASIFSQHANRHALELLKKDSCTMIQCKWLCLRHKKPHCNTREVTDEDMDQLCGFRVKPHVDEQAIEDANLTALKYPGTSSSLTSEQIQYNLKVDDVLDALPPCDFACHPAEHAAQTEGEGGGGQKQWWQWR